MAVGFTLAYNYFLIRQRMICWLMGFLSSISGAYVLWQRALPGQALLYLFYAFMSLYGFYYWWRAKAHQPPIKDWKYYIHLFVIICCVLLSEWIIYYFKLPQQFQQRLDIYLTVFCIIATYFETQKVLSAWLYWIVLNAVSVYLYFQHGAFALALLSLVYVFLSLKGYMEWRKVFYR